MDNYYETSKRMWKDSNILFTNKSWFGTCYLAGYVVECYAKLVLKRINKDVRNYSHRLNNMNEDISGLLTTAQPMAKYCIDMKKECDTIVSQWNPVHRYKHQNGFWDSEDISKKFIKESKKTINIINQMKLDGVI